MNVSALSWSWVAVWTPRHEPDARPMSTNGAANSAAVVIAARHRSSRESSVIRAPRAGGFDDQVPAVDHHEHQQLGGQRDDLRRQHHHAERGQDGRGDQVDDQERQQDVRPILNAVRSPETMNAGISARIGTSSIVAGRAAPETPRNSSRSGSLVCAIRNREAAAARPRAPGFSSIWPVEVLLATPVVHLHRDRRRHEHGHEQREPDQHLVRRRRRAFRARCARSRARR